ncbi:uncharacterized protein LOC132720936 [Ruditapes philippinarum]|uniref:uncharacterized protein LOC132720936 n=1 Tax=Ruditapes philippinarum TaxID=129788 RepID=UPI00295C2D43|nr:uncharacterized protein LOC132720936 [Ruditapes philippinarum]
MAALNMSIKHTFDALDKCGYSRPSANKRIQIMDNAGKMASLFYTKKTNEDIDLVIAGSRGEGIGRYFDCDLDRLFIQRSVMCYAAYPTPSTHVRYAAEFRLDFQNTSNGYCRLKLISKQSQTTSEAKNFAFLQNMETAIHIENGEAFLRNDKILTSAMQHLKRTGWLAQSVIYDVDDGPSKPYECRVPFSKYAFKIDNVLCFKCVHPTIIQEWCDRKREHDWPSSEIVEQVKGVDVLVVPVGETADEVLQWRISLVLAELVLAHSFNDVQLKVYGALKMLSKNVFRKSCDNMSSYMIKNVVFWVSEKTQNCEFEQGKLLDRITDGLIFLRKCVDEGQLPNYMIPGRNLLKYKLSYTERENVLIDIDNCLQAGEHAFLECPELIQMSDEAEAGVNDTAFKELAEESIYSLYTFPLMEGAKLIKKLYSLKSGKDVVKFYLKKIFPKIRENNPLDFFCHICSKTDKEILRILKP